MATERSVAANVAGVDAGIEAPGQRPPYPANGATAAQVLALARRLGESSEPVLVSASPASGDGNELPLAEDVEPRADVAEGLPPAGGAGGSAQGLHALSKYRGVTPSAAPEREAPCGCKWYPDGTTYKCLSHPDIHNGCEEPGNSESAARGEEPVARVTAEQLAAHKAEKDAAYARSAARARRNDDLVQPQIADADVCHNASAAPIPVQELARWERETGEHRDNYPLDPDEYWSLLRASRIREATSKVRAKAVIDFVKDVRGA